MPLLSQSRHVSRNSEDDVAINHFLFLHLPCPFLPSFILLLPFHPSFSYPPSFLTLLPSFNYSPALLQLFSYPPSFLRSGCFLCEANSQFLILCCCTSRSSWRQVCFNDRSLVVRHYVAPVKRRSFVRTSVRWVSASASNQSKTD